MRVTRLIACEFCLALVACTSRPAPRGEFVGYLKSGSGQRFNYYRAAGGRCQVCPLRDTAACNAISGHPDPREEACLNLPRCWFFSCSPTGPIMR